MGGGLRAARFLRFFEQAQPGDDRPRRAIEQRHAWVRGEIPMMQARAAGGTRDGRSQSAARRGNEKRLTPPDKPQRWRT